MKKENGITLIALIITIIIMLILVGVTVNVALNGGLFKTAKDAAERTQIETDREILQSAVWGAIGKDGYVDFEKLDNNLPNGFTGSDGRYRSDKGNNFIVDEYGTVIYREPSTGDLLLLEKYFLGESGAGKDLLSLVDNPEFDPRDIATWLFKNDSSTIADASECLKTWMYFDETLDANESGSEAYINWMIFVVRYNEKFYRVKAEVNFEEQTIPVKSVELLYEKNGREGEKVKFDGNNDGVDEDWMILYNNGDTLEIVSMKNMGELTLGSNDTSAQNVGDVDKDGITNTDIDKAIYSYNNAIKRLNDYCAELVKNPKVLSVRCLGSNPDNPLSENNSKYESEKLQELNSLYNKIGKNSDTNFLKDITAISCNNYTSNGERFWLASRSTYLKFIGADFYILNSYGPIEDGWSDDYNDIWSIKNDGTANASRYQNTYGVRPVVKVKSNEV